MVARMVIMIMEDASKIWGSDFVDDDARARLFFSYTLRELICHDAFYITS